MRYKKVDVRKLLRYYLHFNDAGVVMKSGIYRIVHKSSGRQYIGSSQDIQHRRKMHMRSLTDGRHHSQWLQRSWNIHGADAFGFDVLLLCDRDNLLFFEQRFLDHYPCEYNMTKTAGSRAGVKHTAQQKAAMSQIVKAQWERDPDRFLAGLRKATETQRELLNDAEWLAARGRAISEGRKHMRTTVQYKGQDRTLIELADEHGLSVSLIRDRLALGWDIEKALSTPPRAIKKPQILTYNGVTKPIGEFAKEYGMKLSTLSARINTNGWSVEDALTIPTTRATTRKSPNYMHRGELVGLTQLAKRLGTSKGSLYQMIRRHGPEHAIDYYEGKSA